MGTALPKRIVARTMEPGSSGSSRSSSSGSVAGHLGARTDTMSMQYPAKCGSTVTYLGSFTDASSKESELMRERFAGSAGDYDEVRD